MAYWLFSQMYTTGSFQIAARLADSWRIPWFNAPSPKKQRVTSSRPASWAASAAPVASPMPPPTIPFAPRIPASTSAMCMDPPFPLQ